MKKVVAILLSAVLLFGVFGCEDKRVELVECLNELKAQDVESVKGWSEGNDLFKVSDEQAERLIELLNRVSKEIVTENRDLRGTTPLFGVIIETKQYEISIIESIAPYGALEVAFTGTQFWIADAEMRKVVEKAARVEK